MNANQTFTIAAITVEPQLNQILRGEDTVQVERQVMLVLLYLVDHANQVVTRESMITALWPDTFANDEALTQAISKLRKALGDSPGTGRVIQTIRKVGYRLVGPVSYPTSPAFNAAPEPARQPEHAENSRFRGKMARRFGVAAIVLLALMTRVNVVMPEAQAEEPTPRVKVVRMILGEGADKAGIEQAMALMKADSLIIREIRP